MEYMTDIESMNIRYENGGESFKDGESVRYESASPSTKLSSRSYLFESKLDVQMMMTAVTHISLNQGLTCR